MPALKGVTVALQSQYDARTVPEQVAKFSLAGAATCNGQVLATGDQGNVSHHFDHQDFPLSTIDVLIPIYPNSQFWISYDCLAATQQQQQDQESLHCEQDLAPNTHISCASPTTRYFLFKLLVNNTQIVSWGVGAKDEWQGKTFFALQSAGSDFDGKGVVEKRGFFFPLVPSGVVDGTSEGSEPAGAASAAFEISVFRALARRRESVKRASPTLTSEEERSMTEKTGVQLISLGHVKKGADQRMYSYALLDPKDEPWVTFRYHLQRDGRLEKAAPLLPPRHSPTDSKKQLADQRQGSLSSITDTKSEHRAKAGKRVTVPKAVRNRDGQAGTSIQRPSNAMTQAGTIRSIASSPGPSPSPDPYTSGASLDPSTDPRAPSATRTSEDSVARMTRSWLSRTPSPMGSRLFDQPSRTAATVQMHARPAPPPKSVKFPASVVAVSDTAKTAATIPDIASTEDAGRVTPTADERSAKSKATGRRKPGSSSSSAGLLKSVVAHAMKKREAS